MLYPSGGAQKGPQLMPRNLTYQDLPEEIKQRYTVEAVKRVLVTDTKYGKAYHVHIKDRCFVDHYRFMGNPPRLVYSPV